ncbi:MAG: hypothetical protein ABUL49_01810, partial [bacterium]
MTSDAVIVLGSPRSGTSSVAQALNSLDVFFDADSVMPGNADNPDGYWEHKELAGLFGPILRSMNQPAHMMDSMPENWREYPRTDYFLRLVREVIQNSFLDHQLWGWKAPSSSTLVPFILEALKPLDVRPHFVICVRHPLAVAQSAMKKYGFTREACIGVWLWKTLEALNSTRGLSAAILPFPEVVQSPREHLQRVVGLVPGWIPSQESWTKL